MEYSSIEEINSALLNNLINRRALDLAMTMTEKKCYLVDYLDREKPKNIYRKRLLYKWQISIALNYNTLYCMDINILYHI